MQTAPNNPPSFEMAYDELQQIVAKMESGELTLEESVGLYERGQQLAAYCEELLAKAELRVQKLNADGTLNNLG